jgi:hypothetical protein
MYCRHFRDSIRRVFGKYGNVNCRYSKVGWFFVINEYNLSWIVFGGFIRLGCCHGNFGGCGRRFVGMGKLCKFHDNIVCSLDCVGGNYNFILVGSGC